MIQLTKPKPRGDYAYEEGIQMVWTAWTRPRCCFNSDFFTAILFQRFFIVAFAFIAAKFGSAI